MRIVAGNWRGRHLEAPKGRETRPTSDRVREGLFDALSAMLGTDLGGGAVLDLFAGSGALGLEALSRGAARAVFVERDQTALRALRENIEALGATGTTLAIGGDVLEGAWKRASAAGPYALLLVDPPYRIEQVRVVRVIECIVASGGLAPGAVVALEHSSEVSAMVPEGFETIREYGYGGTSVTLMRAGGGEGHDT